MMSYPNSVVVSLGSQMTMPPTARIKRYVSTKDLLPLISRTVPEEPLEQLLSVLAT